MPGQSLSGAARSRVPDAKRRRLEKGLSASVEKQVSIVHVKNEIEEIVNSATNISQLRLLASPKDSEHDSDKLQLEKCLLWSDGEVECFTDSVFYLTPVKKPLEKRSNILPRLALRIFFEGVSRQYRGQLVASGSSQYHCTLSRTKVMSQKCKDKIMEKAMHFKTEIDCSLEIISHGRGKIALKPKDADTSSGIFVRGENESLWHSASRSPSSSVSRVGPLLPHDQLDLLLPPGSREQDRAVLELYLTHCGTTELKDKQFSAALAIGAGNSVALVAPTGYGKTLVICCGSIAAAAAMQRVGHPGHLAPVGLVVAPTLSLLEDAVSNLPGGLAVEV